MIIYNVTVNIDNDVREEWLQWMKEKHIPDVLATGLFTENRMFRVMVEEENGTTYSIQYACNSMQDYETYRDQHAPRLQKEHTEKYSGKFAAFRTLLEKV